MKKQSIKKVSDKKMQQHTLELDNGNTDVEIQEPEKAPVVLHRTCKTVTIGAFKEAFCHNNLTALIISGEPSHDELKDAWDEILFDYALVFKTKDSQYLFELSQKIDLMDHHISFVEYAEKYLTAKFEFDGTSNDDVVDELTFLGYDVTSDTENGPAYLDSLKRMVSICKTNLFELEDLKAEYSRLNNTATGKKQSEEDFDANILMLSRYQHYPLNEEKDTIYRYAIIFNNYLREMTISSKKTVPDAE